VLWSSPPICAIAKIDVEQLQQTGFYESQQAPPEGTKIPSNINSDAN